MKKKCSRWLAIIMSSKSCLRQLLNQFGFGEDLTFKRLKNSWSSIDHNNVKIAIFAVSIHEKVINTASSKLLKKINLRSVSLETTILERLEITIIFLGGVSKRGINFRAPGGLLYSMDEKSNLLSQNIFIQRSI
ncbi:hypothetical protein AVEN_233583-1 [Araneus ventricosus]|uniref:Uncharacterized protein n=1 Tax=Araneus ventricosus TaxID=182803 RepID=A0A4Y2HQU0_ARAVE|nr:hypothetical protein AVEN_233583-1 [Araneus ventricosus]